MLLVPSLNEPDFTVIRAGVEHPGSCHARESSGGLRASLISSAQFVILTKRLKISSSAFSESPYDTDHHLQFWFASCHLNWG